jgi:hypothetical protein
MYSGQANGKKAARICSRSVVPVLQRIGIKKRVVGFKKPDYFKRVVKLKNAHKSTPNFEQIGHFSGLWPLAGQYSLPK